MLNPGVAVLEALSFIEGVVGSSRIMILSVVAARITHKTLYIYRLVVVGG